MASDEGGRRWSASWRRAQRSEVALEAMKEVMVGLASKAGPQRPSSTAPAREDGPAHSGESGPDRRDDHFEARFRALVEQIPAVTFMASLDGGLNEVYVSPQIETMLGYTHEEWVREPTLWYYRLHPEDRARWNVEFARGIANGGPFRAECRFLARDGRTVWVHGEARLIRDGSGRPTVVQGVAFDITESKLAAQKVEATLHEKEVLLREIHHRVKNNLQITSSMLRLQAAECDDPEVSATLRESQNRIKSMALVHEQLYGTRNLSRVPFDEYTRSLVAMVARSYGSAARRVRVELEVEPIELPIDTAIPCGLVLNELLANCFKHAFPDGVEGRVRVRLARDGEQLRLSVSDDGRGLPEDFDLFGARSLGLQLVTTLCRQLEATVSAHTDEGAVFTVELPGGIAP